MRKTILILSVAAALPLTAHAQDSIKTNMLRDAITPIIMLKPNDNNMMAGESDNKIVKAKIVLDKSRIITAVKLSHADQELRIPDSGWSDLTDPKRAWLEERGALTTLIIEGGESEHQWRTTLIFHSGQLFKRRLSRWGEKSDQFIFYSRDEEMKPSKPKRRAGHHRGFDKG